MVLWMNEKRTTARALHDADGVEDWRVLFSGAHAYFRARSFEHGARFVAAIAEVAEAVGHFPDVDLRPEGVTVRTASGEYGALSQRDVELARRISVEARRLQVEPDPSQVQVIGIAVAQDAGSDVGPFWAAVLGYKSLGADEDVVDRHRRNPHVSFQPCTLPSLAAGVRTSTSACLQIRPRQESRRPSQRADAWPTRRTRPSGGRSLRPRTTASTSRPGRISKTTTASARRQPRISAVVFDLGGVLIDWDPRYLYRTLFDDEVAMEEFLATVTTQEWNRAQDAGRPWAEAVEELSKRHPQKRDLIEAYWRRWPETLGEAIEPTVALLAELRSTGIRLYALSNWSGETFPLARPRYPFLELFDGIVISGDERLAKPDPRIFAVLLERYGLAAGETLFIDDHAPNVEAAAALGFTALRFVAAADLRADLERLGLLAANSAGASEMRD